MARAFTDRFDRQYFDRYYRSRSHRVFTSAERGRRVAMAVAAAEYVLGRQLRTVLDIGAGEGHWRAPLVSLRPRLEYTGLDPSEYAVRRFGKRRNIRLGSLDTIGQLGLRRQFDLVLAVGFLNYLPGRALEAALTRIQPFVRAVALLELFTADDPLTGDIRHYHLESTATVRRRLGRAGLIPIGLHLYAPASASGDLAELEHFGRPTA